VLVVWEPIAIGDFASPNTKTMARIPDGRVRQFWDPQHLLAKELVRRADGAKSNPSYPRRDCCVERGFDFDEAALYAPGSRWRDDPTPLFWNGAVVDVIESLEKSLREQP
jgi:hypothetical protein